MTRKFIFAAPVAALSLIAATATAQGTAPSSKAPDLSDPEVAHVAVTANAIDIDAAKFAQTKASNAEVKKFAATMITDHTAVNGKAGELAARLKVTPKDNAVSQSLTTGAKSSHEQLRSLSGAAFDRAYMDREIAYHQAVVDALDKVLVPTTENAELRKLLTDVRPAIVAHLEHAKMIRASLGRDR